MNNANILENYYKRYMNDLSKWLPDGMIDVDLEVLKDLDLLNYHKQGAVESAFNRYFHVMETEEKLTLVNEDFIIWIVPQKLEAVPVTCTLIALNKEEEIRLELAFTTSGVYNNSHLVMRLLEKYLLEIQYTDEQLAKLEKGNAC